jgi:hypothetical protein
MLTRRRCADARAPVAQRLSRDEELGESRLGKSIGSVGYPLVPMTDNLLVHSSGKTLLTTLCPALTIILTGDKIKSAFRWGGHDE